MKIIEPIVLINAKKTVLGKREVTLTLDTDTEEVAISTPAMFVDPVISLRDLQVAVEKLVDHKNR